MENPGGGGGGLRPLVRASKLPCAPGVVAIADCFSDLADVDRDDAGVGRDDTCSTATVYPETPLDDVGIAKAGEPSKEVKAWVVGSAIVPAAATVGTVELLKKVLRSKRPPTRGPEKWLEHFALW